MPKSRKNPDKPNVGKYLHQQRLENELRRLQDELNRPRNRPPNVLIHQLNIAIAIVTCNPLHTL